MEQNPQGCLNCFCSGVTRECNSAKLYRSQVTVQITDNQHGFILSERNGVSVPNLRINIDQNEISYTFSSTPARSPKLYWSLPAQFTGNKVRFFRFIFFFFVCSLPPMMGLTRNRIAGDIVRRSNFHHATLRRTSGRRRSAFYR